MLWHDDVGTWLDYDLLNDKRREYFVTSNLFPLWTKAYNPKDENKIIEKVLDYVEKQGLDEYPGGVPNTFEQTGEQWDFPNVWPPLQVMSILTHPLTNKYSIKFIPYLTVRSRNGSR